MSLPAASIRYRLVVAEDNPADVRLLQEALREEGLAFDMSVFEDGERTLRHLTGLEQVENGVPHLVIMDLNLPRMTGPEVLERLRQNRFPDRVPVMILTSSGYPPDLERVERLGAQFVRKPGTLEEFLQIGRVVKDLLNPR